MTFTDKNIIQNYLAIFESLTLVNKRKLIKKLSLSLKNEKMKNEISFYKSFGAFSDEKTSDAIIFDIKSNRKFKNKEINF